MIVICFIALQLSPVHFINAEVKGKLINDQGEKWYVDIGDYLNKHPEYKEWNISTVLTNSNDCLLEKK